MKKLFNKNQFYYESTEFLMNAVKNFRAPFSSPNFIISLIHKTRLPQKKYDTFTTIGTANNIPSNTQTFVFKLLPFYSSPEIFLQLF